MNEHPSKGPWLNRVIGVVVVLIMLYGWGRDQLPQIGAMLGASPSAVAAASADDTVAAAYAERRSNVAIQGHGTVTKLLSDDTRGSRHQRFILRLDSGQTLLVAHNIDLAPRIDALAVGDIVAFAGEYEWNERGGVLHWTHRDPHRQHPGGWLEHDDRRYQ